MVCRRLNSIIILLVFFIIYNCNFNSICTPTATEICDGIYREKILPEVRLYYVKGQATISPLVSMMENDLYNIPGVTKVELQRYKIAIYRSYLYDWDIIESRLINIIRSYQ